MAIFIDPKTGETSQTQDETKFTTPIQDFNPSTDFISSPDLETNEEIKITEQPDEDIFAGVADGAMAGVNNIPTTTTETTPDTTDYSELIKEALKSIEAPTDLSGAYQDLYGDVVSPKEEDVAVAGQEATAAQEELDLIKAQLQGIVAKAQAQSLALEGQASATGTTAGTTTLLNKQQKEINRQAAIAALPLEAQALTAHARVAAAQGKQRNAQNALNMAMQKFNTLFTLKQNYYTNLYNHRRDQQALILDYLSTKEQRQYDKMQKEDDRRYNETRDNLQMANDLANQAIANGQSDLAGQISNLDENSPTFMEELGNLRAQIETISPQDEFERNMALEGYTLLKPSDLQPGTGIKEEDLLRLPSGDIYKKPPDTTEKDLVLGFINKYPDAGILPTDSLDVASSKLGNSKIYRQQTRLANGSGPGPGPGENTMQVGNEQMALTGDTFIDTVNYLKSLRRQDMFNDFNYENQINSLVESLGYTRDDPEEWQRKWNEISSKVNNAMKDSAFVENPFDTTVVEEPEEEDNVPTSDFIIGGSPTHTSTPSVIL